MSDYLDVSVERDEFHRRLGGGLPTGSLMLIEGKYGYGKSIICQRLAYSTLIHGTPSTYISNELSTKDFIQQMDSLKYDITPFLIDQSLLFIPMFPIMGHVVFRKDPINRLMASERLFDSSLIVIDTLSFMLAQERATEKRCFELIKFFKRMTNMEKTIIVAIDPDTIEPNLLSPIRSLCDIHFELSQKPFAGDLKRFISINRFKRSKSMVQPIIPFRVEPGEGIGIEISSMV